MFSFYTRVHKTRVHWLHGSSMIDARTFHFNNKQNHVDKCLDLKEILEKKKCKNSRLLHTAAGCEPAVIYIL